MKYVLIIMMLFFSACSIKNYDVTQTKIIIIKSPKLKFADAGYIRNSSSSVELELFVAGRSIEKFSVNHLVCTSEGCMSKSSFNSEYLNSAYPDDILQDILLARPIYGSKNKTVSDEGFEQYIKDENVDIKYVVSSSQTYFKDKKNAILFKLKDTN